MKKNTKIMVLFFGVLTMILSAVFIQHEHFKLTVVFTTCLLMTFVFEGKFSFIYSLFYVLFLLLILKTASEHAGSLYTFIPITFVSFYKSMKRSDEEEAKTLQKEESSIDEMGC